MNGYHTMAHPTTSPTPTLSNLSLGKNAIESSTYRHSGGGPLAAVDGIEATYTHTNCNAGIKQWWEVDLADMFTIVSVHIVNRLDCCGGRLHDFTIYFLDEDKNEVDSIFGAGGLGNRKTFPVGFANARYVKIELGDFDCLQLGEVEVWGF